MRLILSMTIISLLFLIGCGSNGGGSDGNKEELFSGPAKVIVDANIDVDVSADYLSDDLQWTHVYFVGNLKNTGGKTALYPRIYFYAEKENTLLAKSVCPQALLLHPNNTIPFKVEAKALGYYNPFATADYNYYEIVWDDYEDSIKQQIIPGVASISAGATLFQSTNNPVYDMLRISVSLKDQYSCDLPFESIPISVNVKITYNNQVYFEKDFGPFIDSKDIMNMYVWPLSHISIKLEDTGLNQYEVEKSKITISVSTPHQGIFYYEIENVGKCFLFC